MNLTEGTKGWFTPSNGAPRVRAEVIKVWGPQCVNLRCEDGSQPSSVLIKQDGCTGYYFEPDQPDAIETEIQAKGLTAPRVTPADIEAEIIDELFFTAYQASIGGEVALDERPVIASQAHRLLTFCVLTLRNGFTVTGESACASPENFDAELGRKIARQAAVNKIWPLKGYELRTKLAG